MDAWQAVSETVRAEFADIPDLARLTRILLRLVVAALLGGMLGFERERRGKSAGLRTHMLVALGSCVFVMVPQQAGVPLGELARVVQGLVTGVGFLGAGTILKKNVEDVKGLTTAAGIWLTAAIGMTVGLGYDSTAVLSAVLALVILSLLGKLEAKMGMDED